MSSACAAHWPAFDRGKKSRGFDHTTDTPPFLSQARAQAIRNGLLEDDVQQLQRVGLRQQTRRLYSIYSTRQQP